MFLTRKNLRGGKSLSAYPIIEVQGCLARKLGYCDNCNNQICIKLIDLRDVLAYFRIGDLEAKTLLKKLQPKPTWQERLIKWLGGQPIAVDY